MTAFFTFIGNYLIGWIVLGYVCLMLGSAWLWGRILRLNEKPRADLDLTPLASDLDADKWSRK